MTTHPHPLRAAAVSVDITPADLTDLNPMGTSKSVPMDPTFSGVHDPISARILVLECRGTMAVLVSLDAVEVGETADFRAAIEQATEVPAANVLMWATHSHNAPRIGTVSPGSLALRPLDAALVNSAEVQRRCIPAIRVALAALAPATVSVATGHADVNVHRMEFTSAGWREGFDDAGPSDKRVQVVRIDAVDGPQLATLFTYGVHSTVTLGTGEVSGDLAGAAARCVEARSADDIVALFAPAAIGDQGPRVRAKAAPAAFAYDAADALGLVVGAEAHRVSQAATPIATDVLAVASATIALPTSGAIYSPEEDHETVQLRLTALRLGDLVLAGVSGEVDTELADLIERAAPRRHTLPLSLVNDRIGYLPSEAMYARTMETGRRCAVAPGRGERAVVDGLAELFRRLEDAR
ncbi:MAG: neutral/alkaline non-lysosomal ceramidase N-terminal domain-containing protein [Microbacterium sp.]|uniref:neutral/alkaline non-lysosomal ceramidase N-terminal domain-containing protein n=1 Tax=Microbacterium sp. TaxID=51671 RepID=UPI0039E5FFE8